MTPRLSRVHDPSCYRHQYPCFRPFAAFGIAAQVFVLALGGSIQLSVSGEVYAEYEEVISRPRLQRDHETIESTLRAIREQAFWVKATETVRACSDPDDDIFLECAQASQAAYIVTGNLKHFPEAWEGTRIVTARRLLQVIQAKAQKASE
ncbi:MAG TPA: putative toxin-antitoxin system toxin component, PIN family [Bryobacteraceae bacterium]|nr:putative toxin-antitoxin system toxin component, PIN family [Bryobacteraceae bacterium]